MSSPASSTSPKRGQKVGASFAKREEVTPLFDAEQRQKIQALFSMCDQVTIAGILY